MASPRSPARTKTIESQYPFFPHGKGRRTFPVETPKEYGNRLKVMSAYLNGIYSLLARFKDNYKAFEYRGMQVKRKDIRNLLKQWTDDFKDLKRFYTAGIANAKSKGRKGGGFKLPEIISPKMYGFLKAAELGSFFLADGTNTGRSLKDEALTNVLDDSYPLHGVIGRGVLLTLFATYIHENNLVGLATVNQGKPRGEWNGNWIGADDLIRQVFAEEIARGVAESDAHQRQYGEVEGQAMKVKSGGAAAKPAKAGEKLKVSQEWHRFTPDMFRWSDISKVLIKGNVTKNPTEFNTLDQNVARAAFPTKEEMTPAQISNMARYNELLKDYREENPNVESVPYTALAVQAAGVGSAQELFTADTHLFSRATSEDVQQLVSSSNKGLVKFIKKGIKSGAM